MLCLEVTASLYSAVRTAIWLDTFVLKLCNNIVHVIKIKYLITNERHFITRLHKNAFLDRHDAFDFLLSVNQFNC